MQNTSLGHCICGKELFWSNEHDKPYFNHDTDDPAFCGKECADKVERIDMGDYWIADGCTYGNVFTRANDYRTHNRQKFLRKYNKKSETWPFIHGIVKVDDSWFDGGWGLDPLVIPLLRRLNTFPHTRTIASCQGNALRSPSVMLSCSQQSLLKIQTLFHQWETSYWWNNVIIVLDNMRDRKTTYCVMFYDTLALMQFTEDVLGVSLEEQLKLLPSLQRNPERILEICPVEEIRAVLNT